MDEYRFRAQQSPRTEAPMNSLVSPPRNGTGRLPQPAAQDPRTTLPRRFTTDSGRVPTLSSIITPRLPEPQDYAAAYKVQLLEKKKLEYEKIREQKRRFEAEMQKLDQQQLRDEFDIAQMQEELGHRSGLNVTGHQSEPTTPPEYREAGSGFPTMFSRPNRYSTSSLVSPAGLFNRPARSGSQLASPSGLVQSVFNFDHLPSRSVPASRRNSDEDEKEQALRQDPTSHRSTNALNRYSMPVTRRRNLYDNIDQTNAAGFLFRDDDSTMESNNSDNMNPSNPNMNSNNPSNRNSTNSKRNSRPEDTFPQLYAQRGNPSVLSASSATADLASQLGSAESSSNHGWGSISHHRHQQSLTSLSQMAATETITTTQASASTETNAFGTRQNRHSVDLSQQFKEPISDTSIPSIMPFPASHVAPTPPKLQTSFSANDIPTVKNVGVTAAPVSASANAHAQQHFHNHNASIGRIPPGAKRHSRELSGDNHPNVTQAPAFASIQSHLQGNAPTFGPVAISQAASQAPASASPAIASPGSLGYPSYYSGPNYTPTSPNGNAYNNMPLLTMGMQQMNINNGYSPQNYTGYNAALQTTAQTRDSQQRVIQQRRAQDNEAMSRFSNMSLESIGGTIYELCKDQHGCRYLQKQLENRNPDQVHMIWLETNEHVVELMTDPFGNYLCQKLLEFCNDEERTVLIRNAATDMVRIALNQHGTRALQKMIEFITTPTQVRIIIGALQNQVVDLIQDLNGNHVIQKCLNKLKAEDAQFIFSAVGNHCIDVGTHRHGCCVLQRCIDHASGDQKIWLIGKITENALRLVQDPFGNYVVQYIIDLNEPTFTEPLVQQFGGKICQLSRHKFSSNVIEKCLRCASDASKDMMAKELLVPGEMERLLRDSFGNYVVQTALEHSTCHTKHQIVEAIRPILPTIRNTPYGRRLQAKIQQHDSRSTNNSGQTTPADPTQGQIPMRGLAPNRGVSNQSMHSPGAYLNGLNGVNGGRLQMPYPSSNALTVSNPPNPPPQPPRMNNYQTYPGVNMHPGNGDGFF